MKRRRFLKSAGAALTWLQSQRPLAGAPAPAAHFLPCINQATTEKADFRTAMDAYAKAGFHHVELWLDSVAPFLEKESTAAARRVMADRGIVAAGSCCEEDLFHPRVPDRDQKLEGFKRKLEVARELGAQRFVMYSAISEGVKPEDHSACLPRLREIGEIAKQHDMIVGVEFIAGARFLGSVETTAKLLRQAAHPNLGIQFDTFHFYAGVSKLEDLENLKHGEISFVHIDDVPDLPRELLEDRHRVYVGEGVMPHEIILRALARVYQGPLSFEVFQYAGDDPFAVAKRAFDGLSRLLAWL